MSEIAYLTEAGLKKLKDNLDHFINVERPNISKQIGEARDKGDLSENAEYDAAKEAQGLLEMRISRLQETVRNARVIDLNDIDIETVQILNVVKLKNLKTNVEMEYTIVSESEANLREKRISVNTPIAKGLLGKKVGDVVEIQVPIGLVSFEIINISI
jgi:transcription elongation factor GreA